MGIDEFKTESGKDTSHLMATKNQRVDWSSYSKDDLKQDLMRLYEEHGKVTRRIFNSDSDTPHHDTIVNKFNTSWAKLKEIAGVGRPTICCPICGDYYGSIGLHWGLSCSYPQIPEYKQNLLIGIQMSDGTLCGSEMSDNKAGLAWRMTNERFMDWLSGELGFLCKGYSLHINSEKSAKKSRDSGFNPNARKEDYHDQFYSATPYMPQIKENLDWYEKDNKRYPENLKLNPTILKMWYSGDGGLNWNKGRLQGASIKCSNEKDRPLLLTDLFSEIGFNVKVRSGQIKIPASQTPEFLEYIGPAPPGFSYKWEIDSRERYNELKESQYDPPIGGPSNRICPEFYQVREEE